MMDWRERIIADPQICHGRPCIKGTRIMVTVVLDNLASGMSVDSSAGSLSITFCIRYSGCDCLRRVARRRACRAVAGLNHPDAFLRLA